MGAAGLDWQTLQIPLSGGLSLKDDKRAGNPPSMDTLRDVEFDDIDGLRTRSPYQALGTAIVGGGNVTNFRRLVRNGDELLLFTDTQLYSWVAEASAWSLKGTHLAAKVDQRIRFATIGDQTFVDRAQLSGVIVFVWMQFGNRPFIGACDSLTGATIVPPTAMSPGLAQPYVRVVALQTKLLVFLNTGINLFAFAVDPANVASSIATGIAGPTFIAAAGGGALTSGLDVCQIAGTDTAAFVAMLNPTTSYLAGKITAALVATTSTKARTCDGAIACSASPDGLHLQVVRGNGVNVQGDELLVSTLADVFTAQAIGTVPVTLSPLQIAACHRSVQNGGHYRCYVFWDYREDTTGPVTFATKFNWVDDNNALGAQAVFRADLGVASRAFDYNGSVYVHLVFAGDTFVNTPSGTFDAQAQNTYYLFRDDQLQVAKEVPLVAGGYDQIPRCLPGVARVTTGVYAWAGIQRRFITTSTLTTSPALNTQYSYRNPVDVTITFDSNDARRCVRLGRTLYVTGGELLQYDGTQLVELGWSYNPWVFLGGMAGAAGNLSAGVYAYKGSYRYDNAVGERDRSSAAAAAQFTAALNNTFTSSWDHPPMRATRKPLVAMETWRTPVNPTFDSPFYLVTSQDPTATINPNAFIFMTDAITLAGNAQLTDTLSDALLLNRELHPENGSALENLAPPGGTVLAASESRLFLAGVPGDPDRVWYSKQRTDGLVASFNDALVITVPQHLNESITALAVWREILFIFRSSAVYIAQGAGLDNAGGGQNYAVQSRSLDVGAASQESVVVGPFGVLFKTEKGWYVIDDTLTPKYVGADVASFDGEAIRSAVIVEKQHQVRVVTSGNHVLVWDYLVNKWVEWTISDGLDACVFQGAWTYLSQATGAMQDVGEFDIVTTGYGMDVELAWIKLNDLQGAGRIRWLELLGEVVDACVVRIRTAYDYEADGGNGWLYRDDVVIAQTPGISGSPLRIRRGFSRQQCEAVKVRITAVAAPTPATRATFTLTNGPVITSGAAWNAILTSLVNGVEANSVDFLAWASSGTYVEVRDHQFFNGAAWVDFPHVVGVRIGTDCTIGQLETAINRSRLCFVSTPSGNPADVVTPVGKLYNGLFTGGATNQPTAESIKLTGLALEVGVKRGLYRKIPASQKG